MAIQRFATNGTLLSIARRVQLSPAPNCAVFYSEEVGQKRAAQFVRSNPGNTRLDELLEKTEQGQILAFLAHPGRNNWSDIEEIWIGLSMRLAEEASGRVHCFGPDRHMRDEPLENYESKFVKGRYANSVFEKAELPVLQNNPRVTEIFLNGRLYY